MERIVSKGDIVIAPEGCQVYLTAGKEYEVIEDTIFGRPDERKFNIIDDNGNETFCLQKGDYHTNYSKWIIKGEPVISPSDGQFFMECFRKFINFDGEVYQKGPDKTLLDVATQIYCSRIISGKYGFGDHVLHGSTDDARKLIEMCTIK
jgi:hypothetical protein